MKHFLFIAFLIGVTLSVSSCSRKGGCPGVRSYTEGGGAKSSKKKGNAIKNKKMQAKKSSGNAPWKKKTMKKDDKKATSGLFSKKTKRKSKQVD